LSRNSGASASRNPKGPSRPAVGKLYLYITLAIIAIIIQNTSKIDRGKKTQDHASQDQVQEIS
jgi:hypothetical protein